MTKIDPTMEWAVDRGWNCNTLITHNPSDPARKETPTVPAVKKIFQKQLSISSD